MARSATLVLFLVVLATSTSAADPVNVLIWDERQPRQSEAYQNFLGNEIAARMGAYGDEFAIRSVWLEDEDQGLSDDNLAWADVIIWWGHVRHSEVTHENAERVLAAVQSGAVDLIVLHSAHWARPFVAAMNWRSVEDAKSHFAEVAAGKELVIETIPPPKERTVPIHGSALTPSYFGYRDGRDTFRAVVHLPYACFPDYRGDGEPSTITVTNVHHPIATGIPETFQVQQTEMYNEPFHVPLPDEVVFEETWALGERFRAGMVWEIGAGRVFYFRPGHETYPVFKQAEVVQVLVNASRWLGSD